MEPQETDGQQDNKAELDNEVLTQINESLASLSQKITEVESKLPVAEEPKKEETDEWKPKSWNEFPEMMKQVAQDTIEATREAESKAIKEQQDKEKELEKQIDAEFDKMLVELESTGKIPKITDKNNPEDPGKLARQELFAMGVRYNSPDLKGMAELRETLSKEGYQFDVKVGKLIKGSRKPTESQDAPVGSSSKVVNNSNEPKYEDVHKLSMDQIVKRFNDGQL